jgi:hypothetical protein
VLRGDGNEPPKVVPPPVPPVTPVLGAAAPPVTHRLSSLAQLARGAVARN